VRLYVGVLGAEEGACVLGGEPMVPSAYLSLNQLPIASRVAGEA
jgi:hypothetical protein